MRKAELVVMLLAVLGAGVPLVVGAEEPQSVRPDAGNAVTVLPVPDVFPDASMPERADMPELPELAPSPFVAPARLNPNGSPVNQRPLDDSGVRALGYSPGDAGNNPRTLLNGSLPAITNVPADPAAVREKLRAAGAEGGAQSLAQQARQSGMAKLLADRAVFHGFTSKPEQPSRAVSANRPGLAQKTPVLPLPSTPTSTLNEARQKDVERITEAIENADNADERDRRLLDLAAAYVGMGDNAKAAGVYQDLSRNANQKEIRKTASLNIKILAGQAPPASVDGGKSTGGRVEK